VAGAVGMSLDVEAQNQETGANQSRTAPRPAVSVHDKEIYELLGFATMTGEDPRRMWARLAETKEWLAGPLAPDSWRDRCSSPITKTSLHSAL
jgi:hypothetical protein